MTGRMEIPDVLHGRYVLAYFAHSGGWRIAKYGHVSYGLGWTPKGSDQSLHDSPSLRLGAYPDPTPDDLYDGEQ